MVNFLTRICPRFLFFVATIFAYQFANAQAPTPFVCEPGMGYILTNVNSGGGNVTSLHALNLSQGTDVLIKSDILPAPNRFLNAFGYNPVDNFLYGFRYATSQIAKVGSNGEVEILNVSGLNSTGQYATGDVSPNGVLYMHGTISGAGSVVAIDLNPASPNYLVAQSQTVTGISLLSGLNDWAFSPVDGFIYGMATDHSLIEYNTITNVVTSLGVAAGLSSETGAFGTAFMDSEGSGYVGNNASGNIYKISRPANLGDPIVAELFSDALKGKSPGDGARCASQPIPPAADEAAACVESGAVLPIIVDVGLHIGEGTFPLDLTSLVLIDPLTSAEVSTVTVTGQGTFTHTPGTGLVVFNPDPGFTSVSVKYKISDEEGHQSGEANINIGICLLPVTLSGLTARSVEKAISLEWKTTSEVNFDHFEVQRSDGNTGNFKAKSILPSQTSGSVYSYIDTSVQPDLRYYYRLKMIDTDGTYAYSKIVSGLWEWGHSMVIAPNPGADFVHITSDQPMISAQLLTVAGVEIFSRDIGNLNAIKLDLQKVNSGIYILRTTLADDKVTVKKIVVK